MVSRVALGLESLLVWVQPCKAARSEGEVQANCLKMTSKGAQSGDQQVYICAAIDVC